VSGFDWRNPDYASVLRKRAAKLSHIRQNPECLPGLKLYYKEQPAKFISDWGITFDPRNVDVGLPAAIPFILFPKQEEWCAFILRKWKAREPGVTEKSRDMGMSWLSVSLACTLCLFNEGMVAGFGSRKEEYVDKADSPKSLFYKARMFLRGLPPEFRPGWEAKRDAPHMRIAFPATRSYIAGEAGDGIGRGDRASIYFVDEAAFLERPQLVEASLSQTTNCRQDISSANGSTNPFYEKVTGGKIEKFTFHWRDDPRKDEAWYAKQVRDLDPVTVAQEIDINYAASVEGVLIPSAWVQAAVDAHIKLGVEVSGRRGGAFDVADEGRDKCAFLASYGILVEHIEEWSGKGSDTFASTQRVVDLCDSLGIEEFEYDADGMGANVRGDARVINEFRAEREQRIITPIAFRGSGEVQRPESQDAPGRLNKDYFANAKAQAWNSLRKRFLTTYRAVTEGADYDPAEIISLSSKLPLLAKLSSELSQPTWGPNGAGKMVVDKQPDGSKSPNLADVVMMRFSGRAPMRITATALEALADPRNWR